MSHIGHPVVGDDKYDAPQSYRDIALHAYSLEFVHPTKDLIMSFYRYPTYMLCDYYLSFIIFIIIIIYYHYYLL